MSFWVISAMGADDGASLVSLPEEGPAHFKYSKGIPLTNQYPDKSVAIMLLDPDYEDQKALYDFVDNTDRALIVTERVKNLIEQVQLDDIEFLPVTLWDHDRQPVKQGYYIVNCIGSHPIIDMEKSNVIMNPLNETQVRRIKNLVLQDSFDVKGAHIFRATTKLNQHFISDELKVLLESAGVTGMYISEANGWDGFVF